MYKGFFHSNERRLPNIPLVYGTVMNNANTIRTAALNPCKSEVSFLGSHNFGIFKHPIGLVERQNNRRSYHWTSKATPANFINTYHDCLLLPGIMLKGILFYIACLSHFDHKFSFPFDKVARMSTIRNNSVVQLYH